VGETTQNLRTTRDSAACGGRPAVLEVRRDYLLLAAFAR
jgi:hypothetical protein